MGYRFTLESANTVANLTFGKVMVCYRDIFSSSQGNQQRNKWRRRREEHTDNGIYRITECEFSVFHIEMGIARFHRNVGKGKAP